VTLSVVQVDSAGRGGGAEAVARSLHRGYRAAGLGATLLVGARPTGEPGEELLRNGGGLRTLHDHLREQGRPRAARLVRAVADPHVIVDAVLGREDFRFPSTRRVLDAALGADVVQLHNLHGAYFDLRLLPELSSSTRVVWCPHDMWPMTGHCAHSLGWDGWREGCGDCPHLRTYPALLRDGTAANWRAKRDLYARTLLRVGVPSRWLADVVADSMLAPATQEVRVIPNGVDLDRFRPGRSEEARARVGLAADAKVLVFAAQDPRRNEFKDYETLERALQLLRARGVVVAALGAGTSTVRAVGAAEVREIDAVPADAVADWLVAADIYVHPARADTFPLGVLEAMACGTPVVATSVGGIPEQLTEAAGRLVAAGDAAAFAHAVDELLADDEARAAAGQAARARAEARFDRRDQVAAYVSWFEELVRA
jgi:glycosyltransferase involved in cell wall biosynthesis